VQQGDGLKKFTWPMITLPDPRITGFENSTSWQLALQFPIRESVGLKAAQARTLRYMFMNRIISGA